MIRASMILQYWISILGANDCFNTVNALTDPPEIFEGILTQQIATFRTHGNTPMVIDNFELRAIFRRCLYSQNILCANGSVYIDLPKCRRGEWKDKQKLWSLSTLIVSTFNASWLESHILRLVTVRTNSRSLSTCRMSANDL